MLGEGSFILGWSHVNRATVKSCTGLKIVSPTIAEWSDRGRRRRGRLGAGVEDLAGLLGRAGGVLADEVEEAGDVLEAGGGGAGAEDADPLPGGSTSWAVDRALAIIAWYQTSLSTT